MPRWLNCVSVFSSDHDSNIKHMHLLFLYLRNFHCICRPLCLVNLSSLFRILFCQHCIELSSVNTVTSFSVEIVSHLPAQLRHLYLCGDLRCRHFNVTPSYSLCLHCVKDSSVLFDITTALFSSPAHSLQPSPILSLLDLLLLSRRLWCRLFSLTMRCNWVFTVDSLMDYRRHRICEHYTDGNRWLGKTLNVLTYAFYVRVSIKCLVSLLDG